MHPQAHPRWRAARATRHGCGSSCRRRCSGMPRQQRRWWRRWQPPAATAVKWAAWWKLTWEATPPHDSWSTSSVACRLAASLVPAVVVVVVAPVEAAVDRPAALALRAAAVLAGRAAAAGPGQRPWSSRPQQSGQRCLPSAGAVAMLAYPRYAIAAGCLSSLHRWQLGPTWLCG